MSSAEAFKYQSVANRGSTQTEADTESIRVNLDPSKMILVNLGCGSKTSDRAINIDWSIYHRVKRIRLIKPLAQIFFNGRRLEKLRGLPSNVLVHDLSKGIPRPDESVDVVYHSHFLEHLDRGSAQRFCSEVYRVLRKGGVHRVVVPDLERLCQKYLKHVEECENDDASRSSHDRYVADLIEQMVRKSASGTSRQNKWRKVIENLVLGDARRRGETHQWMYDRYNLAEMLLHVGFREIRIQRHDSSDIPDWNSIGLDLNREGG